MSQAELAALGKLASDDAGDEVKSMARMTIDEALDRVSVDDPDLIGPETWQGPKDWFGVSTDDGIVAYFGTEAEAYRYRLNLINRMLNPGIAEKRRKR